MTDNYDLEAHEHEHEHGASDEHEPKAEAWHDDQAPVDDLMEDHAAVAEEASGTVHEEVVETKKRKSVLLPAVIGVGVLIAAGAAYEWQSHRSSEQTAHILPVPSAHDFASNSLPHSDTTSSNDTDVSPKTSLASTSSVPAVTSSPSPSSAQAGTAMPISPSSDSSNTASTGLVQPQVNSVSATPSSVANNSSSSAMVSPSSTISAAPVSSAPSSTQPVVASTVTPAPIASLPGVSTPATSSATSTANVDSRLDKLSARIDEMKKTLDEATQQLTQAQASAALAASSESKNTVLEDRLVKVEQQLSQIEHMPVAQAPAEQKVAQAGDAMLVPAVPKASVHPVHKAVVTKHKGVKTHKVKKTAPKTVPHSTQVAKASSGWVLRAATPDEAWVAKDQTSAELRHIQVGDELPGIGRVKAIQQAGDSWAVQGSLGTIH